MTSGCIQRHPNQEATSITPPIRRENTLESWHKVNIATISYWKSLCFNVFDVCNQADLFGPLDGSPCNLYCAFKSVVSLVSESVAQSCEKSKFGLHGSLPRVWEHKAACTVGIFYFSRFQKVSQAGGLLVPKYTSDKHSLKTFDSWCHRAKHIRRTFFNFRQPFSVYSKFG